MNKLLKTIIWLFIAAPAIYLVIIWQGLPQRVALHFNLQGIPDRYGSKNELITLVGVLVGLAAAIWLLLPLVYKIDPKKTAVANKVRLQRLAFAITIFISLVSCILISSAKQQNFNFNIRLVFAGVGLLLCIVGNYMHNIKPNYFAGLRLPWTLNNENNWRKTHLLAGKLWFAGGLLIAIFCFITSVTLSIIIFVCVSLLIILIPGVYSYRLYKQQKSSSSPSP